MAEVAESGIKADGHPNARVPSPSHPHPAFRGILGQPAAQDGAIKEPTLPGS